MARLALALALVAACAVASVHGHAKLNSPSAWNPNPSKSASCGGASKLPVQASWGYTTAQTIVWQTVAGDGLGFVCTYVDTTGSANPTVTASSCNANTPVCGGPNGPTNAPANAVCLLYSATGANPTTTVGAAVSLQINPPVATCGTNGAASCTVVVFTSSAWYACTTVAIAATAPATEAPPTVVPGGAQCKTVNDLSFCYMMNNLNLKVTGTTQSLEDLDALVEKTYNANLDSPLVFYNPGSSACRDVYRRFICYQNFVVCNVSPAGACQNICRDMVDACGLQGEHQLLYACSSYSQTNCADDRVIYSMNGQIPPGGCCTTGQAVGYAVLAVVLAVVVFGSAFLIVIKVRSPETFSRYAENTRNCWDDMLWKMGCGGSSTTAGQKQLGARSGMI